MRLIALAVIAGFLTTAVYAAPMVHWDCRGISAHAGRAFGIVWWGKH